MTRKLLNDAQLLTLAITFNDAKLVCKHNFFVRATLTIARIKWTAYNILQLVRDILQFVQVIIGSL